MYSNRSRVAGGVPQASIPGQQGDICNLRRSATPVEGRNTLSTPSQWMPPSAVGLSNMKTRNSPPRTRGVGQFVKVGWLVKQSAFLNRWNERFMVLNHDTIKSYHQPPPEFAVREALSSRPEQSHQRFSRGHNDARKLIESRRRARDESPVGRQPTGGLVGTPVRQASHHGRSQSPVNNPLAFLASLWNSPSPSPLRERVGEGGVAGDDVVPSEDLGLNEYSRVWPLDFNDYHRYNCFAVSTKKRILVLSAKTEEDRKAWIRAFASVCEKLLLAHLQIEKPVPVVPPAVSMLPEDGYLSPVDEDPDHEQEDDPTPPNEGIVLVAAPPNSFQLREDNASGSSGGEANRDTEETPRGSVDPMIPVGSSSGEDEQQEEGIKEAVGLQAGKVEGERKAVSVVPVMALPHQESDGTGTQEASDTDRHEGGSMDDDSRSPSVRELRDIFLKKRLDTSSPPRPSPSSLPQPPPIPASQYEKHVVRVPRSSDGSHSMSLRRRYSGSEYFCPSYLKGGDGVQQGYLSFQPNFSHTPDRPFTRGEFSGSYLALHEREGAAKRHGGHVGGDGEGHRPSAHQYPFPFNLLTGQPQPAPPNQPKRSTSQPRERVKDMMN
ncbi:unnamed protein product [Vitrella brassicaformis CCMP3155]|uniref:PH domain-containing protein n=3 Tax=Vitrella brassicaformis TaxID=1169539 RepID=A0A0G4H7Y5_VITBC|nr:unnamed protein product [Vitrella brassicaformis CCMP3155]|eukprot:CEM40046.1 unnamed protein product [Vitrella brassicaformis CCMP3155]